MDNEREQILVNLEDAKEIVSLIAEELDRDNYRCLCSAETNIDDAIAFLKAQQPRVMTLEELYLAEHKGVYIERRNSRLYFTEPAIVIRTEKVYIESLGDKYIFMRENKLHDQYWGCDYNKKWRCWTSRPTDKQREDTKWTD